MSGDSLKKVAKKAAKVTMIGALTEPFLKKGKGELDALKPQAQPEVDPAIQGMTEQEMNVAAEEGSGELIKKKRKTSTVLTSPLGTATPTGTRPTLGG